MTAPTEARSRPSRLTIAGASSLRGKELKQLLEESSLPIEDLRLFDEEFATGILTEAAGEPTIIQPVDEESFQGARLVFFTGSPAFARLHAPAARRAGAAVIDLSDGLVATPGARTWIPALDSLLAPPPPAPGASEGGEVYVSPSAAAIVACTLAAALAPLAVCRLAIIFFQPVSEHGQPGIDELETQSVKLLSFKPIAQDVFDTQVAFNMLSRYGDASRERLSDSRDAIAASLRAYLDGRAPLPAVQLVHAPVFYASAFSAFAEFDPARQPADFERALEAASVRFTSAGDAPPSNISAAGSTDITLARIERDSNLPGGFWLWGAVDNLRLSAANAISIAERLLAF